MTDWSAYRDDIVAFGKEFALPDGVLVLEEHQKRILRHVLTPDSRGKLPYRTVVYSAPKKSGKSTISALVALWFALREHYAEVIVAANDLDQAQGRVYRILRRAVELNPTIRRSATIRANRITFGNGSEIRAIPSDYSGEAGANQSLVVHDELWGVTSEAGRRLYDELSPVPTRPNSIRWISTYAGFTGESVLLEDLFRRGMAGARCLPGLPCYAADGLFVYWDHVGRMPWQTDAYYAAMRATLRPSAYLRLHENRWASGSESFIDLADYDRCVDAEYHPPLGGRAWAGLDASTKHDATACMVCGYAQDRVKLLSHRIWTPSPDEPINFRDVADFVKQMHDRYDLRAVYYDPYQLEAVAQGLRRQGVRMTEYPQTSGNLTKMSFSLLDLLKRHSLQLYSCLALRKAAAVAVAVESTRGLKISKRKSSHSIDALVALAMAVQATLDDATKPEGIYLDGFSTIKRRRPQRDVWTKVF